jgi:hypothetical protein
MFFAVLLGVGAIALFALAAYEYGREPMAGLYALVLGAMLLIIGLVITLNNVTSAAPAPAQPDPRPVPPPNPSPQPDEEGIAAEQFVLRDEDGHAHAALKISRDGTPRLAFYDPAGNPRIGLGILRDGSPHLYLYDNRRLGRVEVGLNDTGNPYLIFRDEYKAARVVLTLRPDGSPNWSLYDEDGSPIYLAEPMEPL